MKKLIRPKLQNQDLIQDIHAFTSEEGFKIWWLAQSGFLIKWQGKHLLFDPYLSDSLTVKYQATDKPHTRMSELVVSPEALNFIDIVTSSHNHTDHLDAETLLPIFAKNTDVQFIIPQANRAFVVDRLGCTIDFPIGLNVGLSYAYKGFKITGVPAAHNELLYNEKGECHFMGFIAEFGGYRVYHSGDTLWYDGMVDILKPYSVDVAFLPINGNKPERKVAGNLNPQEAAQLAKAIGAALVIPHHYDLFEFNTEDSQKFVTECKKMDVPFRVLEMGEGVIIHRL